MRTLKEDRLYTLDGIRGLAAICVGLYHCEHVNILLIPDGYLAVDFFFALSGLVISRAYDDRLRNGLSLLVFLRMRLIRLYPLYLIGSIIGLASLIYGTDLTGVHNYNIQGAIIAGLPALFMIPNPLTTYLYPANPPAWSLWFELCINNWAHRLLFACTSH